LLCGGVELCGYLVASGLCCQCSLTLVFLFLSALHYVCGGGFLASPPGHLADHHIAFGLVTGTIVEVQCPTDGVVAEAER
jgi:hypothetical protein